MKRQPDIDVSFPLFLLPFPSLFKKKKNLTMDRTLGTVRVSVTLGWTDVTVAVQENVLILRAR